MSPEITTQNISYISERLQRKGKLLQTKFRIVRYYRVPNYTNYSSVIVSAEAIKHLTKGSDVSINPYETRHSAGGWSAPAEGPSHSIDQSGGKVHGQVGLANISSKLVPKKQCHKQG